MSSHWTKGFNSRSGDLELKPFETHRWSYSGTIVKFGQNTQEYVIRSDENDKLYRRNRKFLKPQIITPVKPPDQPVKIPVQNLATKPASILVQKPTTENDQTSWTGLNSDHWAIQNRPKRIRKIRKPGPVSFGQAPNEIFTYEPEEDNQE